MAAKIVPDTMADKPAARMMFAVVIFILLSPVVVFPLVFICYSPFSNDTDKC
jgi:hypothetical protein